MRAKSLYFLGLLLVLVPALRAETIYKETFEKDNGSKGPEVGWTQGKNIEVKASPNTWHQNVLGHRGYGAPLGWSPTGGRSGAGFAYSESPWYLDDNHGEFYWFHIIFRVNNDEDIGVKGKDFRNAVVRLSLRGENLDLGNLKLYFWMQGEGGVAGYYTKPTLFNWALTSQPLEGALRDGKWHDMSLTLVPDETQWSQMGLIHGGLNRKIIVLQSRTAATDTLEGILGGKHWNFGFLLCGLDPRKLPTGKIDINDFSIETGSPK